MTNRPDADLPSEEARCPRCGTPLPSGPPCPACTLALAADGPVGDGGTAAAPLDPNALDALLPGYAVEALVGRGGMADVFRARDERLGRTVAIKVLRAPALDDPATRAALEERFEREARVFARLDHPNVVRIHDFGHVGGETPFLYLVLEYVEGVTLRTAVARGDVGPGDALMVVEELGSALAAAHDLGIVHRDVKPENVLVDADGRLRLADFGLAKLVGAAPGRGFALTRSGEGLGTPLYVAPEQLRGDADVGPRADVYALAVVVYELLTGRLPVGRFAPPSGGRAGFTQLDDVLLRALAEDPLERQESARVLRDEFASAWPRRDRAMEVDYVPDARGRATRRRELKSWALAVGMLATLTQHWTAMEIDLGDFPVEGRFFESLGNSMTGRIGPFDGSTYLGILSAPFWSAAALFVLAAIVRTAARIWDDAYDRFATGLVVLGAYPALILLVGDARLLLGAWLAIAITILALVHEFRARPASLPTLDALARGSRRSEGAERVRENATLRRRRTRRRIRQRRQHARDRA